MTWDRSMGPRCNIGPAEISRRRRTALAFALVTAAVAVAIVASGAPPFARLLVWPFAAATAITWLQVVHRFCVAFGALGIENFGRIGEERAVDREQRAADRRRALQIALEGSAIAGLVTLALVLLPA